MSKHVFNVNKYNSVMTRDQEIKSIAQIGVDATQKYIYNMIESGEANSLTNELKNAFSSDINSVDALDEAFAVAVLRYALRDDTFGSENLEQDLKMLRDPGVTGKTDFRERYYDVINAVLSTTIPAVSTTFLGRIAETSTIGYGDTKSFTIENNEIFEVSHQATGKLMGASQRKHRRDVTINPADLNITFDTDWYQIASGIFDFGKNFYRASAGYAFYFTAVAYDKFKQLTTQIPAAYRLDGWDEKEAKKVAVAVQSANNNMPVSLLGTKIALSEVIPANDYFKFGISEEWFVKGYVGTWAGYALVEIMQLLNPTNINEATTRDFLIDDDHIYVLPVNNRRPIKIVFEGGMRTTAMSAIETVDMTERASLTYRVGIEAVYDQIYGDIKLI